MNNRLKILLKVASEYWKIPESQIIARSRKRDIVLKRQILQYIATVESLDTLKNIGAQTGSKDHATVMHSKKTIKNLMYIKDVRVDIEKITRLFKTTSERTEQERTTVHGLIDLNIKNMEKLLIIDKAFDVFRGVVVGRKKDRMKVEIKKNDYSERKDKMMKTIEYKDILTSLSGRIEILHLNVFF